MLDMAADRERMVTQQLARRGIHDRYVLEAMREVPREVFVRRKAKELAYKDCALAIEAGQTISQPYIVGLMLAAAEVRPGDSVLEIGSGSGYATAVISRIAAHIYAIERLGELTRLAARRLKRLGYSNITLRSGDGTLGWPEAAPFDAILVAAGGPEVPPDLTEQLAIGGRLVMPVGKTRRDQRLIEVTRLSAKHFSEEDLGGVRFVPLIGEHGWASGAEVEPIAEP